MWAWYLFIRFEPEVEILITPVVLYDIVYFTYMPERCVIEGRPGWDIKRREPLSHAKWTGKSEVRLIFEGKAFVGEVESLESILTGMSTFFRFYSSDHYVPSHLDGA